MQPIWELPLQAAGIEVELNNGERLRIRPIRPEDRATIQAAYEHMSDQSRYFRFFTSRSKLADGLATTLTNIDHTLHFAWGVFDPSRASEVGDDSGFLVATARLIRDEDPTSAEAAVAVLDDYQGRGIGRFLIELLVATAADLDCRVLRFEVLRQNRGMIALVSKAGATGAVLAADPSIAEYKLPVPADDDLRVPAGALYDLLRHAAGNLIDEP